MAPEITKGKISQKSPTIPPPRASPATVAAPAPATLMPISGRRFSDTEKLSEGSILPLEIAISWMLVKTERKDEPMTLLNSIAKEQTI